MHRLWRFAHCEFDEGRLELRVHGALVRVETKPLEILRQLLLARGGAVTREQLLESVWPGLTVVDGSIATAISKLRKALGDDGLIVTLPRIGYRLAVAVECTTVSAPAPLAHAGQEASPASPRSTDRFPIGERSATEPPVAPHAPTLRSTDLPSVAPAPASVAPPGIARGRWRLGAVAALLVLSLVAAAATVIREGRATTRQPLQTVAVVPFDVLSGASDAEPLGTAIADETATLLSRARNLAVRPLATMATAATLQNAQVVGHQMMVDTVVTGHVLGTAARTMVTIEAVDVKTGRLLWRDSLDAPRDNLLALQVQLALRIRNGLAKALGAALAAGNDPSNEEGYALFLRSTAQATDPAANVEAIAMLQRAVALDPNYAPAWQALSKRYYIDARYGAGTAGTLAQADAAAQRAVALDPDYVVPAANLVVSMVERGELTAAFTRASDLVRRHPDSVDAQFALSYVYRYAGLLDDAARHCEEGFLLDPRNSTSGLRSCAVVFLHRGDEPRTTNYLHLDEGSQFSRALSLHALVRRGRLDDARRLDPALLPTWGTWRLLASCAAPAAGEPHRTEHQSIDIRGDSETAYFAATHLAYCGDTTAAAAMLARAISGGYCSYPLIDVDPMLAPLRATPAYRQLRADGARCQQRFNAIVGNRRIAITDRGE